MTLAAVADAVLGSKFVVAAGTVELLLVLVPAVHVSDLLMELETSCPMDASSSSTSSLSPVNVAPELDARLSRE